jgi:hypothetical protein
LDDIGHSPPPVAVDTNGPPDDTGTDEEPLK